MFKRFWNWLLKEHDCSMREEIRSSRHNLRDAIGERMMRQEIRLMALEEKAGIVPDDPETLEMWKLRTATLRIEE